MTQLLLYLLALPLAVLIVAKAGDAFVDAACAIARGYGVPQAVIGLTLVSFATTAPEFLTSTMASALGVVDIAYGNAVGSIIANTALVLAVAMIAVPILVERERVHDGLVLLGLGGVLILLTLDGKLSLHEGIGLLLVLGMFLWFVIRREVKRDGRSKSGEKLRLKQKFIIFGISAAGIAIASRMLIYSGVGIAEFFGIPEIVIGLTVIAVGTSIPELATVIISAIKKVSELSLGNIIGANILNLVWVLGTSSVIRPLKVGSKEIWFSNPVMLAIIALLVAFMARRRLERKHGVLFLAVYISYLFGLALCY